MIAHWDEADARSRTMGHLGATWTNLGRAAGTVDVGLQRIRITPGLWSTPAHVHGRQEEIFWVLGGSGLSWQDGETYEVGQGDCLVHLPTERAHTLQAGPDGLDVLAFGMRHWDEAPTLTRTQSVWLGKGWVVLGEDYDHPWTREVDEGPPDLPAEPSARPLSIVNLEDERVARTERRGATVARARRSVSAAAGSETTGLQHVVVDAGKLNAAPHCHSAEEEIFVVLSGEGTLELTPSPAQADRAQELHTLGPGHVISRPAGTGIAHAFRAGEAELTLLAYGSREPNDLCYYPRSNKVFLRGLGLIGRLEPLDYWEGED